MTATHVELEAPNADGPTGPLDGPPGGLSTTPGPAKDIDLEVVECSLACPRRLLIDNYVRIAAVEGTLRDSVCP